MGAYTRHGARAITEIDRQWEVWNSGAAGCHRPAVDVLWDDKHLSCQYTAQQKEHRSYRVAQVSDEE